MTEPRNPWLSRHGARPRYRRVVFFATFRPARRDRTYDARIGAPPGRLERPHTAPEAAALSTELRGQGPSIVLVQQFTSGGASPGVMPTCVVVVDEGAPSVGVD